MEDFLFGVVIGVGGTIFVLVMLGVLMAAVMDSEDDDKAPADNATA